jgi:single-strand DNA-binding protein
MINKTIIQGRFTKEPEIRVLPSGVELTTGRIAWSEKYKEKEVKLFMDFKAWRSTGAFIANYFHKGSEILLEGRLETEEWETDQGEKRSRVMLTVDHAHFCGKKESGAAPDSYGFTEINEETVPF